MPELPPVTTAILPWCLFIRLLLWNDFSSLPRSSALRLLAAQDHATAEHLGDESALVVVDVALDEPKRARPLHQACRRAKPGVPDRLEVLRRQIERRERLVILERGRHRGPHRSVGEIAHDAAVERAHWVGVLRARLHLEDRAPELDLDDREAHQLGDGGRGNLPPHHLLQLTKVTCGLRCANDFTHRSVLSDDTEPAP